jgi:hypothetical protein
VNASNLVNSLLLFDIVAGICLLGFAVVYYVLLPAGVHLIKCVFRYFDIKWDDGSSGPEDDDGGPGSDDPGPPSTALI